MNANTKERKEEAANSYYLTKDYVKSLKSGFTSIPNSLLTVAQYFNLSGNQISILLIHLMNSKDYVVRNNELRILYKSNTSLAEAYKDLSEKGLIKVWYKEDYSEDNKVSIDRNVDLEPLLFIMEQFDNKEKINQLKDSEKQELSTKKEFKTKMVKLMKNNFKEFFVEETYKCVLNNNDYRVLRSLSEDELQLLPILPEYLFDNKILNTGFEINGELVASAAEIKEQGVLNFMFKKKQGKGKNYLYLKELSEMKDYYYKNINQFDSEKQEDSLEIVSDDEIDSLLNELSESEELIDSMEEEEMTKKDLLKANLNLVKEEKERLGITNKIDVTNKVDLMNKKPVEVEKIKHIPEFLKNQGIEKDVKIENILDDKKFNNYVDLFNNDFEETENTIDETEEEDYFETFVMEEESKKSEPKAAVKSEVDFSELEKASIELDSKLETMLEINTNHDRELVNKYKGLPSFDRWINTTPGTGPCKLYEANLKDEYKTVYDSYTKEDKQALLDEDYSPEELEIIERKESEKKAKQLERAKFLGLVPEIKEVEPVKVFSADDDLSDFMAC